MENKETSSDNAYSSNAYSSEDAIFSAQYRRKLFIKHFLLSKRGGGIIFLMGILYYFGLLHVYLTIVFMIIIVAFYLKNKDLSWERDRTMWLIKLRKRFFELLELEKKQDDMRKAKGDFIKSFFNKDEEGI